MAYIYKLEVKLANNKKDFILADKKDVIKEAIKRYNDRSFIMQNPKRISLMSDDITGDVMHLKLESSRPLDSAGRALRLLSIIIIKEMGVEEFVNAITSNGQLFSTRLLKADEKKNKEVIIDYRQVEDVEVVKGLMDYICKKSGKGSPVDYREKKKAFEQIKKIAYDAYLIPHAPHEEPEEN